MNYFPATEPGPELALERSVMIPVGRGRLAGELALPADPVGLVLFAHGSGSSRLSPRNRRVARVLQASGMGTLLFDLLTEDESDIRANVFDIPLLAQRLQHAAEWTREEPDLDRLSLGYFGASTGAAAALVAAAGSPAVAAVVSRGGRPDLAGEFLPRVHAPTLLIVGGEDDTVLRLNEHALSQMQCPKHLSVVAGATHLFEEPGTLDAVAHMATAWFQQYLTATGGARA